MDLLITADFPPIEGGISTVSLSLARKLQQKNHKFTALVPHFPGMEEFDRNEGYDIRRVPGYWWRWSRVVPLAVTQNKWFKQNKNQINRILAMNFSFGGLWGLYQRFGIPYRIFAYGFEFLRFEDNPIMKRIILRIYAGAEKIYSISEFTRKSLIEFGVDESRIEVMQIAIDPITYQRDRTQARGRLLPEIGDAPLLLTVGRLIPRKGHNTVLSAMDNLRSSYPDLHYAIVGRGPEESNLQGMVCKFGFDDRVHFVGYVDEFDLPDWYAASDIMVMPAAEIKGSVEGYGLVFLEAGAAGLPVIGSRSGGIPEAIIENETGFLVSPGDHEELALKISKLIDDSAIRKSLGQKGRIRAEQLWENFAKDILISM